MAEKQRLDQVLSRAVSVGACARILFAGRSQASEAARKSPSGHLQRPEVFCRFCNAFTKGVQL